MEKYRLLLTTRPCSVTHTAEHFHDYFAKLNLVCSTTPVLVSRVRCSLHTRVARCSDNRFYSVLKHLPVRATLNPVPIYLLRNDGV